MELISKTWNKAEDIACKYLEHSIRNRLQQAAAARFGPLAASLGFGVGFIFDAAVVVGAASLPTIVTIPLSGIGLPLTLLLIGAYFTADC